MLPLLLASALLHSCTFALIFLCPVQLKLIRVQIHADTAPFHRRSFPPPLLSVNAPFHCRSFPSPLLSIAAPFHCCSSPLPLLCVGTSFPMFTLILRSNFCALPFLQLRIHSFYTLSFFVSTLLEKSSCYEIELISDSSSRAYLSSFHYQSSQKHSKMTCSKESHPLCTRSCKQP